MPFSSVVVYVLSKGQSLMRFLFPRPLFMLGLWAIFPILMITLLAFHLRRTDLLIVEVSIRKNGICMLFFLSAIDSFEERNEEELGSEKNLSGDDSSTYLTRAVYKLC